MRSEAVRRAGSAPSQPAFNSQNDAPASASTRGKTKTSNSPHRSRLSENVQEPFYIFLTTSYFGVPEIVFSFSDLKILLVRLRSQLGPAGLTSAGQAPQNAKSICIEPATNSPVIPGQTLWNLESE